MLLILDLFRFLCLTFQCFFTFSFAILLLSPLAFSFGSIFFSVKFFPSIVLYLPCFRGHVDAYHGTFSLTLSFSQSSFVSLLRLLSVGLFFHPGKFLLLLVLFLSTTCLNQPGRFSSNLYIKISFKFSRNRDITLKVSDCEELVRVTAFGTFIVVFEISFHNHGNEIPA